MGASLLIISRAGTQYGVPVAPVLELAELSGLTPLHALIPGCLGTISHRGYLMPVFDPPTLGTDQPGSATQRFVVLSVDGAVFGLLLDSFVRIGSAGEVEDTSTMQNGNPYTGRMIASGDGVLVLLSVDAIAELVRQHFTQQRFAAGPERTVRDISEDVAEIYLSARIESILFAVPVEHVIEIVEGSDVTPLFNVPPLLRGLMNLRGQVLACLDISGELGFPPRSLEERNQFVILRSDEAELALCVDKVTGIRRLSRADVQRSEPVLGGELGRLASGVHEGEDGTMLILSVPAVFDAPALSPFRKADA